MAPSVVVKKKKEGKEKKPKVKKPLSAKSKAKAASQDEVERSMKIANMLLQQEEVVHSEDEGLSDDNYIKSLKVDPIAVDKGDEGFEVDKGDGGIVMVMDEKEPEVIDTREKRPKVANSLRSLRLAIAAKMKKTQDDRKSKLLAKGGFASEEE